MNPEITWKESTVPQFEVLFDICLEGCRKTENRQDMGCAGRGEALLLELTCLAGHVKFQEFACTYACQPACICGTQVNLQPKKQTTRILHRNDMLHKLRPPPPQNAVCLVIYCFYMMFMFYIKSAPKFKRPTSVVKGKNCPHFLY
jgi:hypothetical protein